jgi:hypothetical protein
MNRNRNFESDRSFRNYSIGKRNEPAPSVKTEDIENGANPRGDLETICRRDSRFEWPNFETHSQGPTHHQVWAAYCSIQINIDNKKNNLKTKGIHPKKTKAISIGKNFFLKFRF